MQNYDNKARGTMSRALKEVLDRAILQGMSIGAKSVSSTIYDMLKDARSHHIKKDLLKVINEVKGFCETGLAGDIYRF